MTTPGVACTRCGRRFDTHNQCSEHFAEEHVAVSCETCYRNFGNLRLYNQHAGRCQANVYQHQPSNVVYSCPYCLYVTCSDMLLSQHVRMVHNRQ